MVVLNVPGNLLWMSLVIQTLQGCHLLLPGRWWRGSNSWLLRLALCLLRLCYLRHWLLEVKRRNIFLLIRYLFGIYTLVLIWSLLRRSHPIHARFAAWFDHIRLRYDKTIVVLG